MAILLGALLTSDGRAPDEIVTFGAPKPGFAPLAETLAGVKVRQYWHGHDPVPLVPIEPFCHVRLPLHWVPTVAQPSLTQHAMPDYVRAVEQFNG